MPVKRKVKSEVAAAWWMVRPANSARYETMSTPPTPTVPISRPTNAATAARKNGGDQPAAKATSSLVSSTASFFMRA